MMPLTRYQWALLVLLAVLGTSPAADGGEADAPALIDAPPMPWLIGNCRTDAHPTRTPESARGDCCPKR